MPARRSPSDETNLPTLLLTAEVLCCDLGGYMAGGQDMPKYATVRDLKNKTTALIREVEKGKAIVVTRRGKPMVTLKPFESSDKESQYPTTAFDALRNKILAKNPSLGKETPDQARRKLDKLYTAP